MATQESEPKKPGLARESLDDCIEIRHKKVRYVSQIRITYYEHEHCAGHTAVLLRDEVNWSLGEDIPVEKISGMKRDLELRADVQVREFNTLIDSLQEAFPNAKIELSDPLGEPEDC